MFRWVLLVLALSSGLLLACTDQAPSITSPAADSATGGDWVLQTATDPLTDQSLVSVNLLSTDKAAILSLYCAPSSGLLRWWVDIRWGKYVAHKGPVKVWTRYDDEPASESRWLLAANSHVTSTGTETVAPEAFAAIVLADDTVTAQLLQTTRFIARVQRHDQTTLTKQWQTEGLAHELQALREQCQQRVAG